jgi:RNA polymerase sigma factor (sigma-70 family)
VQLKRPRSPTPPAPELDRTIQDETPRLLNRIARRLRDRVEAEDVLQDVFADFVEAHEVGAAIESVGAWLTRVAQHKVLDRFRRASTREDGEERLLDDAREARDAEATPEDELERAWLREALLAAITELPPEQREVFVRHELEGQDFATMARELGVSVNTLLSRKRYAVLFLRELLKEVYDEIE